LGNKIPPKNRGKNQNFTRTIGQDQGWWDDPRENEKKREVEEGGRKEID